MILHHDESSLKVFFGSFWGFFVYQRAKGVAQNLHEIGALCKKNGVLFHTDAAQAVGKIPLDVKEMNVAMMSISGHKIYGPKGIGALYVRRKPRVRLEPMMSGGGQERGYRSGTLPHNLVVGLGEACRIAGEEMEADHLRICQARATREYPRTNQSKIALV